MNNKDINITDLIKKYEQMRYMNKKFYFDADEFTMIANYYINAKDTSEAQRAVDIGLSMHSNNFELMLIKAKVFVASEKYEVAYSYLLSMGENEANVDLLLLKFECLIKLNRIEEANSYLEYILGGDLNEQDYFTFIKKVGYLYNDAEVFDTAITLLEKAKQIESTNTNVLIELAYAYEMDDNLDRAIEITNSLIDLNPYSFDAWVALGRLYMYNLDYKLSIEAYDFALAIKEADVDVLKLKAITYGENYDFENEMKVLNECIDAAPDDESLYEEVLKKYKDFEAYWGIEQDEEILKVLEKKEAHFGPKGLLLEMAHLNLRLGRKDKAQEIFNRLPEEDKYTLNYYKVQGDLAIRNRNEEAAEAAYMMAFSESPDDVEVLDTLAEINFELDRYEKSAEYLEQLIAIDPEYGIAKFRLASVRFEVGEEELFDKAINQISDKYQLELLFSIYASIRSRDYREKIDYSKLSREELITGLIKARENNMLLKKK